MKVIHSAHDAHSDTLKAVISTESDFLIWMKQHESQVVGRGLPAVRSDGGGVAATIELLPSQQVSISLQASGCNAIYPYTVCYEGQCLIGDEGSLKVLSGWSVVYEPQADLPSLLPSAAIEGCNISFFGTLWSLPVTMVRLALALPRYTHVHIWAPLMLLTVPDACKQDQWQLKY